MYKEPSWFKPFKRGRLDLENLTDAEIEKLRIETTQIIEENERKKMVLANKHQQIFELSCEVYGKDSNVTNYLRKAPFELPHNYRESWSRFSSAIQDARRKKAVREKQRERRKQLAAERAEREAQDNSSVGPQEIVF